MAIAADATVPILRQTYATNQKNGWMPGVISSELLTDAVDISGYTTSETTYTAKIPADFKDHKTVFVFVNNFGSAKTVTFKAGNGHARAKDLTVSIPNGTSAMWLESAPFVDKFDGTIELKTNASQTDSKYLKVIGYEMR